MKNKANFAQKQNRSSWILLAPAMVLMNWQRGYCRQYPSIKENSIALLECLKVFWRDMEKVERISSMACVYASPELMGRDVIINEILDVYPSIHAHPVSEENDFEDSMIQLIYGSPEMINSDSKETKTKRNHLKHEVQMAVVYGSPEMMQELESKESFFSKLFKRKR